MKYMLTLLPVLLVTFLSNAQEYQYVSFPDSNAVWSEIFWDSDSPTVYNKYALFNEDTIINGVSYHKLFHAVNKATITRENSECIGGIREDSLKRVFVSNSVFPFSHGVDEVMLFDFFGNEGDTIWRYTDIIPANFIANYLIIENIDTLQIQNSRRKVFYFNSYEWSAWIEGIGSIQGLLFSTGDITTGGANSELICMHQNDTLLYFNSDYDDCVPSFVSDGVSLLENPDVKVYPNPVTDGMVYFENLDFETLELFDLSGKVIRKENINGADVFELNVSELSPGTYSYRLKTKGLVPTMGKLIIR